ncbi:recombinase family protein [Bacillus thuringiensis]|uniref:recombinase family protein n=1 Tax=Bacillus thuringiensis TaxID=1428 RepID=UPI00403E2F9C
MEGLVVLKKTVAYYRSSSKKQEHSVRMQQYYAKAYCRDHYMKLDYEYKDPYVSARIVHMNQRSGLRNLMEAIRNDEVEHLILYKRDRLARNVIEYMEIYELLQEKQIKVHFTTVGEPALEYTPMNRYLEVIMAGFAQHEGEQINKRFDAMRQSKFDAGKAVSRLPYGFENNKKTKEIEMIQDEIDIVMFIFNEFLDDTCTSLQQIKDSLDAKGFKKRKGTPWALQDIRRTLENSFYMGVYSIRLKGVQQEQQLEGTIPIEPHQWEAAQEKLNRIVNKRGSTQMKKEFVKDDILYRLEGLLQCSYCKKQLEGVVKRRGDIFLIGYQCKEHGLYIDKEYIEQKAFEQMKYFFLNLREKDFDCLFQRYYKKNVQEMERIIQAHAQRLDKKKKTVHTKVQRWLTEKKDNKLHKELLGSYRHFQDHKCEKEELELKLNVLKKIPSVLKDLQDNFDEKLALDSLPGYKGVELFQDLIFTVIVDKHGYEIIFKHPFLHYQEVHTCEDSS